jgi:hypothetical protein
MKPAPSASSPQTPLRKPKPKSQLLWQLIAWMALNGKLAGKLQVLY